MILDSTRRRTLPRRAILFSAAIGTAVLAPLAMLRLDASAQTGALASAARSQQARGETALKQGGNFAQGSLLIKYYGEEWYEAHPDAVRQAMSLKPLPAAALYGHWAEAYGGLESGKSEQFLLRAQALEPNNPQWPDRLGDIYGLKMIHASARKARLQAQKALAEYETAAKLIGDGQGVSTGMAVRAFDAGEYDQARQYADALVQRNGKPEFGSMAAYYPSNDELHHAHLVLGRLAVQAGNISEAEAQLQAMGQVSGSPVLDTFGPNMLLAQDLLRKGDTQPVLDYFDACGKFWKTGSQKLAEWKSQVQQGKAPGFGGNTLY